MSTTTKALDSETIEQIVRHLVSHFRSVASVRITERLVTKAYETSEWDNAKLHENEVVAKHAIAKKIHQGAALTRLESNYLCQILVGPELPRKKTGRGRPKSETGLFVHMLVSMCQGFGLQLYRNEATSDTNSACDVAAEVMKGLSLTPASYSGIKNTYLGMQKSIPSLRDVAVEADVD